MNALLKLDTAVGNGAGTNPADTSYQGKRIAKLE
jgi:hypothetical protein